MSDTATARGPDTTAWRRNPGVGHASNFMCMFCQTKGAGSGWALYLGVMACGPCRTKKKLARKAKK